MHHSLNGAMRAGLAYIPGPEAVDQALEHVERALEALEGQQHELGTVIARDNDGDRWWIQQRLQGPCDKASSSFACGVATVCRAPQTACGKHRREPGRGWPRTRTCPRETELICAHCIDHREQIHHREHQNASGDGAR